MFWFVGAFFGLVALITVFISFSEWDTRKKDPEKAHDRTFLGFACVGAVSAGLALLFWSL
ncbi:hypothetical protein LO771_23015 [Streptacidiphilus sp. ASG 303]|uniref:hypothetical protein n=1 Tax=Streptacidiphilus sp. ASG 303 TaxID=2896847 RepID=UPI001E50AF57|nr:hypothetical protein [Streptacidiphilus sp. ASG 303]MCD0485174.1 hypothetical protein [Streptacidiphilus sp. ASG 303]